MWNGHHYLQGSALNVQGVAILAAWLAALLVATRSLRLLLISRLHRVSASGQDGNRNRHLWRLHQWLYRLERLLMVALVLPWLALALIDAWRNK